MTFRRRLLIGVCAFVFSQLLIGCGAYALDTNEQTADYSSYMQQDTTAAMGTADKRAEDILTAVNVPQHMLLTLNNMPSKVLDPYLWRTNSSDIIVTYHSSDEAVATIDNKGIVCGYSNGECVITTMIYDINLEKEYLLGNTLVTVETAPKKLSLSDVSIYISNACQLIVEIEPQDVTVGQQFTLTSSNEDIVAFNEDGRIIGLAVGTATITAINELGQSTSCKVNVEAIPDTKEESEDSFVAVKGVSYNSIPIITETVEFDEIYSSFSGEDEPFILGTFRCPKVGVVFEITWDSDKGKRDPTIAFADPYGGIPGDIYRNTIVWDSEYQFGRTLSNNLEVGDQVSLETNYGIFVYAYKGSRTAIEKEKVHIDFPADINERYCIEDVETSDYVAKPWDQLFRHSWGSISPYADGKLIICTGHGLSEITLTEFELVCGPQLLY